MVEPGMHAEAVIFDFVQPLVAVRRGVDELGVLRRDPFRHGGRIGPPPARYGARHDGGTGWLSGRRMHLLELVLRHDLARPILLRHGCLDIQNLSTIFETGCNRAAFGSGLFRKSGRCGEVQGRGTSRLRAPI
jgi:hypothetical protein